MHRIRRLLGIALACVMLLSTANVSALALWIETDVGEDALAFARVYDAEVGEGETFLAFYDAETGSFMKVLVGEDTDGAELRKSKSTELRQMLLGEGYVPLAPAYRTLVASGTAHVGAHEYEALYVLRDTELTGNVRVLHKLGGADGKTLTLPARSTLTVGNDAYVENNGLKLAGAGELRLERLSFGNVTFNGVQVGDARVEYCDLPTIHIGGLSEGQATVAKLELSQWQEDHPSAYQEVSLSRFEQTIDETGLTLRFKEDGERLDWDSCWVRLTLSVAGGGTVVYDPLHWGGHDNVTPEWLGDDIAQCLSDAVSSVMWGGIENANYGRKDQPITYSNAKLMLSNVYFSAWNYSAPLNEPELLEEISLEEHREEDWYLQAYEKDYMLDRFIPLLPREEINGDVTLSLRRLEDGSERVTYENGNEKYEKEDNWFNNLKFNGAVTVKLAGNTVSEEHGWSGQIQFGNCEFAGGLTLLAEDGKDFAANFNNNCVFDGKAVTASGENVNRDNAHRVHFKQLPEDGFALSTDTPVIIENAHDGESGILEYARFTVNNVKIQNMRNGGGLEIGVDRMENGRLRLVVNAEEQWLDGDGDLVTGDDANGPVMLSCITGGPVVEVSGYVDIRGMSSGHVELGNRTWFSTVVLSGNVLYVPEYVRDVRLVAVEGGTSSAPGVVETENTRLQILRTDNAATGTYNMVPCAELYDGDDGNGNEGYGIVLYVPGDFNGNEIVSIINKTLGENTLRILGTDDSLSQKVVISTPDSPASVLWLNDEGEVINTDDANWENDVCSAAILVEGYDGETDMRRLEIIRNDMCTVRHTALRYGWRNPVDLRGFGDELTGYLAGSGYDDIKLGGYTVSQYREWDESKGDWTGTDAMYNDLVGVLKDVWPEHSWEGDDAWGGNRFSRVQLGLVVKLLLENKVNVSEKYKDPGMSVYYGDLITVFGEVWKAAGKTDGLPVAVGIIGKQATDCFDFRDQRCLLNSLVENLKSVNSWTELVEALSAGKGEVIVGLEGIHKESESELAGLVGRTGCEALRRTDDGYELTVPAGTVLIICNDVTLDVPKDLTLRLEDGIFVDGSWKKIESPNANNLFWETGRHGEHFARTLSAGIAVDEGTLNIYGTLAAGKMGFIDNADNINVKGGELILSGGDFHIIGRWNDNTNTFVPIKADRVRGGGDLIEFGNAAGINNIYDREDVYGKLELSSEGSLSAGSKAQIHNMGVVKLLDDSTMTLNGAGFNNNRDDRGTEDAEDDICGQLDFDYGSVALSSGAWLNNNGEAHGADVTLKDSVLINNAHVNLKIVTVDNSYFENNGLCEINGVLTVRGADGKVDNTGAWEQYDAISLVQGGVFMHDVLEKSSLAIYNNSKWFADPESRMLVCLIEDDEKSDGSFHEGAKDNTAADILALLNEHKEEMSDKAGLQLVVLTSEGLGKQLGFAEENGLLRWIFEVVILGDVETGALPGCTELTLVNGSTLTLSSGTGHVTFYNITGSGTIDVNAGVTLHYTKCDEGVTLTGEGEIRFESGIE